MPFYDVLVTIDVTKSATVRVEADSPADAIGEALSDARANGPAYTWEDDEPCSHAPYVGDEEEAAQLVEEEPETCAHCGEERPAGPQSSSWLCPNNHFNGV